MHFMNLSSQEVTEMIRALSFYGKDLAANGASTEMVLRLICEMSHTVKGKTND